MSLDAYYFLDPRLVLVPIEHLSPQGVSTHCADLLKARCGWDDGRITLFNRAFFLYWSRTAALAGCTQTWPMPRVRHIGIVRDPNSVRPYAQLLNTTAWTVYECDLDPATSDPELLAYVLVLGDWMALLGEVTLAPLRSAAYWFDRTTTERAAFRAAAARSPRPDADGYRAVAESVEWLAQLHHETLRPPASPVGHRPIAGSGLLVPSALVGEPPALVERWTGVAREVVSAFHIAGGATDLGAVAELCAWLTADRPPLLVTLDDRIVWDPENPSRIGAVRDVFKRASGAGVRDIHADLRCVADRTRSFLAAVADPAALPPPDPATEQRGYVYLHRDRGLIAYNLREPEIERLHGPALPYARAMLGARTIHEWAHLAVRAGWVPEVVTGDRYGERVAALAGDLDDAIDTATAAIREQTAEDLATLSQRPDGHSATPGATLASILLSRLPDYQANLLAMRFVDMGERETYVRQNVRTLRAEYAPAQLWRMLVRYLYEFQYLHFSAVADRRLFFFRSTWFDADFFGSGALTEERFDTLTQAVDQLCACYAVDETRFRELSD